MIELLQNKKLIIGIIIGIFVFYTLLTRKSKSLINFEKEYEEVLKSNKYKAKGQYE